MHPNAVHHTPGIETYNVVMPVKHQVSQKLLNHLSSTILVQLPDNSTFYLAVDRILLRAAEVVAIPGVSPKTHLAEQILPAVSEYPHLVLNIAKELPWQVILPLAARPYWRSPIQVSGQYLWPRATLSLMA